MNVEVELLTDAGFGVTTVGTWFDQTCSGLGRLALTDKIITVQS